MRVRLPNGDLLCSGLHGARLLPSTVDVGTRPALHQGMPELVDHCLAPALRGAIRHLGRALLHAGYRYRVHGAHHVPPGPALLLSNHVGFIDFWLIGAALDETPRFVMHEDSWKTPGFAAFFELHGVIPIAPHKHNPTRLRRAMDRIDDALADGHRVMLFPEGTMTPDGQLSPIRPGFRRVLQRRPVPVVPIALRGVWGSWFSRSGGAPMKKFPRRLRAPIDVVFGEPLPPTTTEGELEEALTRLSRLREPDWAYRPETTEHRQVGPVGGWPSAPR